MAADGDEGYLSREDRIVAEFGDGFDVEGIAFRYGLTVAQVYAVVEREVGPAAQGLGRTPSHGGPPVYYGSPPPAAYAYPPPTAPQGYDPNQPGQYYYRPPVYPTPAQPPPGVPAAPGYPLPGSTPPSPGSPTEDAIVAEYGQGYDVAWIARLHGITAEQVYEVVQRVVADDPPPPGGPMPSW